MAQVRKPEMRRRIEQAALEQFAERGYAGASIASIAAAAGTAPANVYRYVADKADLFAQVVPHALVERHDELLDRRIASLGAAAGAGAGAQRRDPAGSLGPASELLAFWVEHRLQVVILLDRAEGTPLADEPRRFVGRLTDHLERRAGALDPVRRRLVELVFDNTRRAIATILASTGDPAELRLLIEGFWSYQVPGLDGLVGWQPRT